MLVNELCYEFCSKRTLNVEFEMCLYVTVRSGSAAAAAVVVNEDLKVESGLQLEGGGGGCCVVVMRRRSLSRKMNRRTECV